MTLLEVPIINAFVDRGQGGNPAGVVLQAERFDRATKQYIAAQIGISETAFVSPSTSADFKLEFFTPKRQIAHCGHATIATFSYLVQQGLLSATQSSKETIDGKRDIFIDEDMAFMEQIAPRYVTLGEPQPVAVEQVLQSLGQTESALLPGYYPTVVNTGNSFLIVALRDAGTVQTLKPDFSAIEAISDKLDLIGYYLFNTETRQPGREAGTRMFAPRYGIMEEAATGMAAGPLACFLYDHLHIPKTIFVIEQGHWMEPPSPSEIIVRLSVEQGRIDKLLVGGRAQVSRTMTISMK